MWEVEYDNDTGPGDEGFSEWWNVKYGSKSFRTSSEAHAKMLASVLNAIEDKATDFYDGSSHDGEIAFANKLVAMIG